MPSRTPRGRKLSTPLRSHLPGDSLCLNFSQNEAIRATNILYYYLIRAKFSQQFYKISMVLQWPRILRLLKKKQAGKRKEMGDCSVEPSTTPEGPLLPYL